MILEAATAAAMYFSNQALAAESDIPVMVPQAMCRFKEPKRVRACLDRKFQNTHDAYQDMWDPNWISSITYKPEDVINPGDDSAKAGARVLPKSHTEKKP
jgi:hypothetical protein